MKIGNKLKTLRSAKKMTQKELAKKADLSIATIQGYEQDKYQPKGKSIQKLAAALEVPFEELINFSYAPDDIEKYRNAFKQPSSFVVYSGEDLASFFGAVPLPFLEMLANNIKKLNEQGQEKLYDYSCDLLEIEKYRAKDAPKQETTPPEQNNTAPDELLAAHQREDIEPTKEGIQHDLDIMNDESKWD